MGGGVLSVARMGVQGAGFRVRGAGCGVKGAGCRVQGAGFRVQGSGCRVQGAGCRVQGVGCSGTVGGEEDRVLDGPGGEGLQGYKLARLYSG